MNSKDIFKTCCMLIAILLLAMSIFGCTASPSNSPEEDGGQTSQGSAVYGDKQKSLDELVKNADLIVYGVAGDTIIEQTAGRTLEFTVEKCGKGLGWGFCKNRYPNTNIINIMQMYSTSLQLKRANNMY